jgi:hypothetical protein
MDIDEIRRTNLRAIEGKLGPAFYKAADMSPAQFYNLRDGAKDSKTGKRRGMRKETAWKLEDAAGLPRGYLDVPHDDQNSGASPNAIAVIAPMPLRQTLERLAYFVGECPPEKREIIGSMLGMIAKYPHDTSTLEALMPLMSKQAPD